MLRAREDVHYCVSISIKGSLCQPKFLLDNLQKYNGNRFKLQNRYNLTVHQRLLQGNGKCQYVESSQTVLFVWLTCGRGLVS